MLHFLMFRIPFPQSQPLHLLGKEWDLQQPASQGVSKRADGESPREKQGESSSPSQSWVPTDSPSSANGCCLPFSGIAFLNQPFLRSHQVQRRLSRQAGKCFLGSAGAVG